MFIDLIGLYFVFLFFYDKGRAKFPALQILFIYHPIDNSYVPVSDNNAAGFMISIYDLLTING